MRRLAVILFTLFLLAGCRPDGTGAGLITLLELTPGRAEVGDRVEVVGVSFPEGRTATLTFRGDLYRPGQDPIRNAQIVARASSSSSTRLGFTLSDATEQEFCGYGDEAEHTTFRGEVIAAFSPRTSGAPPVAGALRDVVIDFPGPTVAPSVVAARAAEGLATAQVLGMTLRPESVTVADVEAGGRAEQAGIQAADTLVELDGVRVQSVADLRVSGASPGAAVWVRRASERAPVQLVVDVQGVRPSASRDLLGAFGIVGAFVLLLGASFFPGARLVGWVERRVSDRIRQRRAQQARQRDPVKLREAPRTVESEPMSARLLPSLVFVGASAGSATLAFGRPLVAAELDLAILLLVYVTVSLVGGLVIRGWTERRRWSLLAGLTGALGALWARLPVLAAVCCAVLMTGSVRLADHVSAQGASPWTYAAFSNPVHFLAFALLLSVSVVRVEPTRAAFDVADLEHGAPRAGRGVRTAAVVDAVHLMVIAQLGAIVFLGGWNLPSSGSTGWLAVAALLLQLKAWLVVVLIAGLRWGLPRLPAHHVLGVWTRKVIPLSAVLVGLAAVWNVGARALFASASAPLFGVVMFGAVISLGALFALRVRRMARRASTAHVNPWL